MAHTVEHQEHLLHRVRRLRGQLNGVERALLEERDCGEVLLTLAACRGALNALMAEILEGHVHHHVLDPKRATAGQREAADELIKVINRYLK